MRPDLYAYCWAKKGEKWQCSRPGPAAEIWGEAIKLFDRGDLLVTLFNAQDIEASIKWHQERIAE